MADITTPGVGEFGNLLQNIPAQQSQIGLQQQGLLPMYQQEAIGQNIQNQRSMIGLQLLRGLPSMMQNIMSQPSPVDQEQASNADQTGEGPAVAGYSSSRQPMPWTPSLQAKYNKLQQVDMLYKSVGVPTNFADLAVKGPYDAYNANRAELATNEWKQFADVAEYGPAALKGLPQNSPVVKALGGISDPQELRDTAARLANEAHVYSGQKTKDINGRMADENSGRYIPSMPLAGMPRDKAEELASQFRTITQGNRETQVSVPNLLRMSPQQATAYFMRLSPEEAEKRIETAQNTQFPKASPARPANIPGPTGPSIGGGGPAQAPRAQGAPNPQAQAAGAAPQSQATPNAGAVRGPMPGNLGPEQQKFVNDLPQQYSEVPGNERLNESDIGERKIAQGQQKDLATTATKELHKSNVELAAVQRLQNLMNRPDFYTGPGSQSRSEFDTVLSQYLGSAPAEARAAVFQVASKVLNANQMNQILEQFHAQGAQVRLGAYESRLIMTALAANTGMTKTAVQQLLQWGASDAQYDQQKYNTMSAAVRAKKNVGTAEADYESEFPRQNLTITGLSAFNPLNFKGAAGKTYKSAEVAQAAKTAGYPENVFRKELEAAGAKVQ